MEQEQKPSKKRNPIAILSILLAIFVGVALGIFWNKYQKEFKAFSDQLSSLKAKNRTESQSYTKNGV